MSKHKEEKTNVMRTLEQKKIAYTPHEYPADGPVDGVSVAAYLNQDPEQVFKTLVTKGASGGYYVFDIPVAENLDLKKAAKAVGEKSIAMLPQKELLPLMDYFKTDAAEAEVLTGLTDRVEAAKMLHDWGAKEVVITHNTEVLAYDGNKVYTCPIKARNLSGRTGRGDTTFAGYIAERQRGSVEEALNFCTALVSLKMETPGPFKGTREDVLAYMKEFY